MPYTPFYEQFPRIAEEETRSIIAFDDPELPNGDYALIELYCDEQDCDCQRVFFNVFHSETKKMVAVVAFGWETKKYYAKWLVHCNFNFLPTHNGVLISL